MVIWLLACAAPPPEAVPLDPVALLTRISLDVRGVRPSEAELDAVEADPAAVDAHVEAFLADPRFGERVEDLFDEVFLTRGEGYDADPALFGASEDDDTFKASVGGEIPRFVAELARTDAPWTDAVLADWTMADEVIGPIWPTDYPQGETGWRRVRYTDGRPAAGVLAMNSFYWRYDSTVSNANRKRANAITRIFLCQDALERTVPFDPALQVTDEASLAAAIVTDPGCVSCHAAVDPLSSYLFGFFYEGADNPSDAIWYHPEREHYWESYTGVAPAYFGVPSTGLTALARQVAADPRYPGCLVEHVYEGLLRREAAAADTDALVAHREAFIAGDATLRAAWRSVLADPAYRAETPDAEGQVPLKLVTPRLLGSEVAALTGYTWTLDGIEALMSDDVGVRSLAGGIDGFESARRATSPNPTLALVQERLAEAAGAWAVANDEAGLFASLAFTETPETDRAAMTAVIGRMVRRATGRTLDPDGAEMDAWLGLWADLHALDADPRAAWAGVYAAVLRDPALVLY